MLTAISPHTMIEISHMVSFSILSARRTNIRTFGRELWNASRKKMSPTPRELRIEINPNLKRQYSKENKTFVFKLLLPPKAGTMAPQFYFGSSAGAEKGSSYTKLLEQTQASRRELEFQKKMVLDGQEHMTKMEASRPILEKTASYHEKGLVRSEKDKQDLVAQQQQLETKKEEVAKLEEVGKVMTHQPTKMASGEIEPPPAQLASKQKTMDSEVKNVTRENVKGEQQKTTVADQSTYDRAAAEPVDQQTQKFVEEEKIKTEIQELRIVQDVLRNDVLPIYQARVVKQPELLANAPGEGEGEQVVFEVDTSSFNDTRRVNANFRPISFGTSFGAIF